MLKLHFIRKVIGASRNYYYPQKHRKDAQYFNEQHSSESIPLHQTENNVNIILSF